MEEEDFAHQRSRRLLEEHEGKMSEDHHRVTYYKLLPPTEDTLISLAPCALPTGSR